MDLVGYHCNTVAASQKNDNNPLLRAREPCVTHRGSGVIRLKSSQ